MAPRCCQSATPPPKPPAVGCSLCSTLLNWLPGEDRAGMGDT
jgi:hypothetical protein